ncbi:MAG: hypothetical protein ABI661_05125 [Gammaproteobacteria bacterium]
MTSRPRIAVAGLASLLGASVLGLAVPAFADTAARPAPATARAPAKPTDAVGKVAATAKDDTIIKTVDEGFKVTTEKEAVEVLKAANVDLTVAAVLLPMNASQAHVKDAANLALKAVEDSVIINSYSIDSLPMQGKKG